MSSIYDGAKNHKYAQGNGDTNRVVRVCDFVTTCCSIGADSQGLLSQPDPPELKVIGLEVLARSTTLAKPKVGSVLDNDPEIQMKEFSER